MGVREAGAGVVFTFLNFVGTVHVLDGEAFATFAAAARNHGSAALRRHAYQEAMGSPTAAIVGLKCAFHSLTS